MNTLWTRQVKHRIWSLWPYGLMAALRLHPPTPSRTMSSPPASSQHRPTSPVGSIISGRHDIDASSAMDVDQEIDELLSDNEAPPASTAPSSHPVAASAKQSLCKWNACCRPFEDPNKLGEHLHKGMSRQQQRPVHIAGKKADLLIDHLGPAINNKVWTCQWDGCARIGQKQASRHSLVVHCRAHTGERPYECPYPGGCLRRSFLPFQLLF